MIKPGDIYYLSDQFGPKFIKVIMIDDIWEKNREWIFFYKSTNLNKIINTSYKGNQHNGCDMGQVKKCNIEKLLNNFSFSTEFKGCIKLNEDITQSIMNNKEVDISNYPYMEYSSYEAFVNNIFCKKISKEDFRNLKLNKILG